MKILRKTSCIALLLGLMVTGSAGLSCAADNLVSLTGKVIETMNAGGYTYVQIDNSGEKTWVAVPESKVDVGQEISFGPGMVMHDFESKALKRKFESIIFSGGVLKKDK